MHKFLIVAIGLAILAPGSVTARAEVKRVDLTTDQLKDYCKDKGGTYQQTDSGATCSVQRKKDRNPVVIACGNKTKICIETHTQVFTSNRSTHGPIGGGSATTLVNGGKNSVAGSTSGTNSTLTGGGTTSNGASAANKTTVGNASNVNGTSGLFGGGGGQLNGRSLLRQQ